MSSLLDSPTHQKLRCVPILPARQGVGAAARTEPSLEMWGTPAPLSEGTFQPKVVESL